MANQIQVELELLNKKYLEALEKSANKTKQETDKIGTSFNNSSTSIFGMTKAAAGIAAVGTGLAVVGKYALQNAAALEQQEVALEVMLKSAGQATALLAELRKFADVTPFDTDEVIRAGKGLVAYGFDVTEVTSTLTKLGDIAAGATQPLNDIVQIYGKMRLGQNLYAEDLSQLADRGIPVVRELAKVLGVNENVIKKMASEGKISFDTLDKAFSNMTQKGGIYAGLMEKQSQTTLGMWSTLKSQVANTATELGTSMIPATKLLMRVFSNAAESGGAITTIMGLLGKTILNIVSVVAKATAGWSLLSDEFRKLVSKQHIRGAETQLLEFGRSLGLNYDATTKYTRSVQESIVTEARRTGRIKEAKVLFERLLDAQQGRTNAMNSQIQVTEDLNKYEQENNAILAKKNAALEKLKRNTPIQQKPVDPNAEKKLREAQQFRVKLLEMTGQKERAEIEKTNNEYDNFYAKMKSRITNLDEQKKQLALLEKEREKKILQIKLAGYIEIADQIKGFGSQLQNVINGFYDNENKRIEQSFDAREAAIKASTASEKDKENQLAALEKEREAQKRRAAYDEAVRTKTFGIIEATIATAIAVTKSLPNLALAITSGVLGAAQIAMIASQPLPSLDTGTMDVPSDTLANIHKGEIVIPKSFADSIRSGEASLGGGGGNIIVQGSIIDTQGLLNAVDKGRNKRAFGMGVQNYAGAGVYK